MLANQGRDGGIRDGTGEEASSSERAPKTGRIGTCV